MSATNRNALATCCDSVLVCRGSNASLFCFFSLGMVASPWCSPLKGFAFGCILIPVCNRSVGYDYRLSFRLRKVP